MLLFTVIAGTSTMRIRHKLKEQFVVRKDMNVNEHERLSNITLRQT